MSRKSITDSTGYSGFTDAESNFVELYASVDALTADSVPLAEGIDFIPIEWAEDGASAPDAVELVATSNQTVRVRKFRGDTGDEDVYFGWYVPQAIQSGTIKFQVLCIISEATPPDEEGVVFKLQGQSMGSGDALGSTLGTAVASSKEDMEDAQYDIVFTDWSGEVTVTNLAAGEYVMFKLYRDQDATADTYEEDIGVIGINIKWYWS